MAKSEYRLLVRSAMTIIVAINKNIDVKTESAISVCLVIFLFFESPFKNGFDGVRGRGDPSRTGVFTTLKVGEWLRCRYLEGFFDYVEPY